MWKGAWTGAELRRFHQLLVASTEVRCAARIYTFDRELVADATLAMVPGGTVAIDTGGEAAARSLSLTLLDAGFAVGLDSPRPALGLIHRNRIIRVTHSIRDPKDGRWFTVPIFTGPVISFSRNGPLLDLSCASMEHLAMVQPQKAFTIAKGTPIVDAIRRILREAGETRFDFPNVKAPRLPDPLSISRSANLWAVAQGLAKAWGRQLFYGGDWVCRIRTPPGRAVLTLTDGSRDIPGGLPVLLGEGPSTSFDVGEVINQVLVLGADSKQQTRRYEATATAPRAHVLSPWSLARGGKPTYLREVIDASGINTSAKAKERAARTLQQRLRQTTEVTTDVLNLPHLDELDLVRIATREVDVTVPIRTASISVDGLSAGAIGTSRSIRGGVGKLHAPRVVKWRRIPPRKRRRRPKKKGGKA